MRTGIGKTSPVGCFPAGASPYGAEDLSGNVWEWTRSLWGPNPDHPKFQYPYKCGDGRENASAKKNVRRTLRGGSFSYGQSGTRVSYRRRDSPGVTLKYIGFRLALSCQSCLKEAS